MTDATERVRDAREKLLAVLEENKCEDAVCEIRRMDAARLVLIGTPTSHKELAEQVFDAIARLDL